MNKLVIPLSDIRKHKPCHEQYMEASTMYPDGIPLTKAAQQKLLAADIDYWWLECLLSAPVWAEYESVRGPVLAEYGRVRAAAVAEYESVGGPALAEYRRVTGAAWAEYRRVTVAALLAALKRTYRDKEEQ